MGREKEADAVKAWHRLMAGMPEPTPEPKVEVRAEPEAVNVADVLRAFLADCEGRVKPNTVRVYRRFLVPFLVKNGTVKADALTPVFCEAQARRTEWSADTRNAFLGTLQTAFRWAVKARMIPQTPLTGMSRPPKVSRGAEALLTPEEYALLVKHASPQFALFLRVLYLTGCRPGEAAAITADNFDEANGMVRLAEHKTAHKGKSRTIFLCPEAVALLREQKERYPHGALLRNRIGTPWNGPATVKAMFDVRKRAGLPGKICYGLRHTFATDALAKGVPDAQVAALLGHSGTAMLHRHYSHLTARSQALREALGRVRA